MTLLALAHSITVIDVQVSAALHFTYNSSLNQPGQKL